eukprot:CAMPEP_0203757368 /NCGR_PEP_ID=MMETSP0098-20131031/10446_1 /ASSEMBLY_ACC=CAM_ASM_000208 /TAXON_ID=96639 /ORGANISM=" , Strain NY0313808BC1" /LENGTH=322 /DNA_ID=CAMNT_0050649577 /DNA_START=206 /DNA_END=1174 /DNA_ORIENTATION=+
MASEEKCSNGKRKAGSLSDMGDVEKSSKIHKAWDKVFGPLGLSALGVKEEIGKTRPRTHVNPLNAHFQVPIDTPKWEELYEDTSKPLFIDIGCAAGRFGMKMATDPDFSKQNHLGIEIRESLVTRANAWVEKKGLKNIAYLSCNVNVCLEMLIETYPGPVNYVAVQFPDPHFKRKHHKRRVVKNDFLDMLAKKLKPGTHFFVQSDVEEAAAQMRDRTELNKYFSRKEEDKYTPRDSDLALTVCAEGSDDSLWARDGKRGKPSAGDSDANDYGDWLIGPNPLGVPTEREVQNECQGLPIYRAMFVRNSVVWEASENNVKNSSK